MILADCADKNGNVIPGVRLGWVTEDFVKLRPMDEGEISSLRDDANAADVVEVPDELLQPIRDRWVPLHAENVILPQNVKIGGLSELERIRERVVYSDGSVDEKPIFWKQDILKQAGENTYTIEGRMESVGTGFPLAVGMADPVIFPWEGKCYFIATNNNTNGVGLFVRRADTVKGLFEDGAESSVILDYDEERGLCQTFWAPELHLIGGELYILFAVSGKAWGPQCHMMRLKTGGDIMKPDSWEAPVRVVRSDGRFLTNDGITLDMTYL